MLGGSSQGEGCTGHSRREGKGAGMGDGNQDGDTDMLRGFGEGVEGVVGPW